VNNTEADKFIKNLKTSFLHIEGKRKIRVKRPQKYEIKVNYDDKKSERGGERKKLKATHSEGSLR